VKYTVHGSFENPSKAKSYARFSSLDFTTREEAEAEAQLWKSTRTYTYQWIEEKKEKASA
jgi:BMFP domain-containing protein YqiC